MNNFKFKAVVNPFLQQITIDCITEGCTYRDTIEYKQIDEWFSLYINKTHFDAHFLYDDKCTLSIYEVTGNSVDYSKPCDVDLQVTF